MDSKSSQTAYSTILDKSRIDRQIQKALTNSYQPSAQSLLASVDVLQSVDSTNSYLLKQAVLVNQAKLCLAEAQSNGRGRRGNDWQSTPHKNIMLSLSWGFKSRPDDITALGLAVALTIAERLNKDYLLGVAIKWPNDLLLDGDKLAGILVDAVANVNGGFNVVIGLGLNVHQANGAQADSTYAWTDLVSHGVTVDRNELAGNIAADLLVMLSDFTEQGFAPMLERWNALSMYNGKQIMLIPQHTQTTDNDIIIGRMIGIDRQGALLLALPSGEEKVVYSSQYSLRPDTRGE